MCINLGLCTYICACTQGKNGQKWPKSQFWAIFTLRACTDTCAQPQSYAHGKNRFDVYFSHMLEFFTVHTFKMLKTSVHGTWFLGLACMASCTQQSAHKWVMLGIIGKPLPRCIQKWLI